MAALNCRAEAGALTVDLKGLGGAADVRAMTVFREAEGPASCRVDERIAVPSDGRFTLNVPAGGGFLIHLNPPPAPPPLKL